MCVTGATTTSACVWRRLAVGPERRYGHAAVFVPLFRSQDANNLVTGHEEVDLLVAQGGFTTAGTVASSTMVYNASSNTWASHTTAAPALAEHTAVTLDGQVWVFGGVGEGGATVSQLWTYNFGAFCGVGCWQRLIANSARSSHSVVMWHCACVLPSRGGLV